MPYQDSEQAIYFLQKRINTDMVKAEERREYEKARYIISNIDIIELLAVTRKDKQDSGAQCFRTA